MIAAQRHGTPADRSIRSLTRLQEHGSTARMLNLIAVWEKHARSDAYRSAPFFRNGALNRCIVVKHRLRRNEREFFFPDRSSATKIMLPLDITNLRSGARSFFVGQTGYQAILREVLGQDGAGRQHDQCLLEALDALPSLDPFLTRERLRREGFSPARCYFDLTSADATRMFDFVRQEVTPLVTLSFQQANAQFSEKASKLAAKILNNAPDVDMEPLRQGLGLDKAAFEEGVFSWKGFIYYKWLLVDLSPKIQPITTEIATIRPKGPISREAAAYIVAVHGRLTRAIAMNCAAARATLKVYETAYAGLTEDGDPQAFRQFLIRAPGLFSELGARLGSMQHIVSFWRYRFPEGVRPDVTAEELADIFADFEASFNFESLAAAA